MISARKMKGSGIPWIDMIPNEWDTCRGHFIFTQRKAKGNTNQLLLAATQKSGMYPQHLLEVCVQVKEDTDLQTFRTVCCNDFVISIRSFQGGFEMSKYEGVCSPAYQVFHNTQQINHVFFKYLFKSDGFIERMNSLTVGIREGKNILYADFANSYLAIPPLKEQLRIADYLDKKCAQIDSAIAKKETLVEKLTTYKKSLIYECVTGKREV